MNFKFYKRAVFATIFIVSGFVQSSTCLANDKILLAAEFINPADEDVAPGLYRLFEKAKKGRYTKIQFQKGIYHIYSDHAFEKYSFISNHDSGLRKIAFAIIGFNHLEIDGGGAEFIIHGLVIPIAIEDSKDITVRNLFFNHDKATHSELKVVAVNSDSTTIDFEIGKEYPYEIRNGELIFLKYGYEHNLENAIYWDPARNAVAFQSRQLTPLYKNLRKSVVYSFDNEKSLYPVDSNSPAYKFRGTENSLMARQIEPGLVRVAGVKNSLPKPGWILVAKGLNGNNRLAPGIRLLDAENILINNVTVHHASGMGLIAEGCTNITLDGFNVLPKAGGGRILSTNADASHFVGCRGKILMKNCRFENQLDDATNIHGTYMEVTDIGKNSAGARIGHFQQVGYHFARPGDSVVVVNPAVSAMPLAKLTVKKVELINTRYYQITFNEDIPAVVKKGYYLENVQAYPEVEIHDNKFINNRARGLLISTPRKVVIENNVISSMMAGIQCPNEFTFWYESGYVKDITIRNNKFLDNTYGNTKPSAVINIMAASANHSPIHEKFVIENNSFANYSSFILSAEYVKYLVFKNNAITYSGNYPLDGTSPIIHLTGVGTADLQNNRYDSRFPDFLPGHNGTSEKIINTDNKPIR
ncbi:MAG: right-handed parallel beta-helix repeat-containing protein [Chitinophagaceae bacterium]